VKNFTKRRNKMNLLQKFLKRNNDIQVNKNRDVARLISEFYLDKYINGTTREQMYEKARNEIQSLGITNVIINKDAVTITLSRCGLLIGRRGENIDKMQMFLSKELKRKISINIIEDRTIQCLMPYYDDGFIDGLDDY
jgi:ribosomal protein S3